MNKIKNTDINHLENEYVLTLQEEIKMLEYQLKLLKDKELEEQQSLNQIDKFFSDGVPINDNILALKNQFLKKKQEGEKIIENYLKNIEENKNIIERLTKDIEIYDYETDKSEKLLIEKELEYSNFSDNLKIKTIEENHKKIYLDKILRVKFNTLKSLNEKNLQIQRQKDKERIQAPTLEEKEKLKIQNLNKTNTDLDELIKELLEEVSSLKSNLNNNPLILHYDQENIDIQSKTLKFDKQYSYTKSKIQEMEMLLEQRARERDVEIQEKINLINKIDSIKFKLDEQTKMNELIIQQKVKEKEEIEIHEIEKHMEAIKKKKSMFLEETQIQQDEIEQMGHDKVLKQQELLSLKNDSESLNKELTDIKLKHESLNTEYDFLIDKDRELTLKFDPLEAEINKLHNLKPSFENEIKKFENKINIMKQQIEFSKQIKNLNLDDVKVANNSNSQVNTNLLYFIKKFEEIQRLNNIDLKNN